MYKHLREGLTIMKLLSIIYYLGIIACGIQGSKKSCQQHKVFCLPATLLAAMGGGMIRDLLILFVFPAAFTISCMPDVMIALCAGIIYRICLQKYKTHNTFKQLIIFTDALGIGTFIAIGIDKALSLDASPNTALCCGIVTALGGGIISSLLCGQSIHKVMTTNVAYRIITILGSLLYIYYITIGVNPIIAQYWLILYTTIFIPLTDNYCRELLINFMKILKHSKAIVTLNQQNAFALYIPNYPPLPYSFCVSNDTQKRNLHYLNRVANTNFKLQCPRRFSRGR